MRIVKLKEPKDLANIINHILSRVLDLERENKELKKLIEDIDNEVATLNEVMFSDLPVNQLDS